jgi:hypothetical protein
MAEGVGFLEKNASSVDFRTQLAEGGRHEILDKNEKVARGDTFSEMPLGH